MPAVLLMEALAIYNPAARIARESPHIAGQIYLSKIKTGDTHVTKNDQVTELHRKNKPCPETASKMNGGVKNPRLAWFLSPQLTPLPRVELPAMLEQFTSHVNS